MLASAFENSIHTISLLETTALQKKSVLSSCYTAMDEGVIDNAINNLTSTYTQSMILDILDNIKEKLLKVYQSVLSALNNYILNTATLADKYRDLLISRYEKLKAKTIYQTYEYDKLYKMPTDVRSIYNVEKDAQDIVNMGLSETYDNNEVILKVDKYINDFAKAVIGATVNVDNIKASTESTCKQMMRGREVTKTLTASEIDKFIDEIKKYKDLKNQINSTKTQIVKYYNSLKGQFLSTFKMIPSDEIGVMKRAQDPTGAALLDSQYQQYSKANIQLTRLFDGYINIYNAAFNTKLSLLQEKIQSNRNILVEMMTKTSVFAAVHAKQPKKGSAPYKIDNMFVKQ